MLLETRAAWDNNICPLALSAFAQLRKELKIDKIEIFNYDKTWNLC